MDIYYHCMDSLDKTKIYTKKVKSTSKTASVIERPVTSSLTTEQRIATLANIIVDRILDYQKQGLVGPIKETVL